MAEVIDTSIAPDIPLGSRAVDLLVARRGRGANSEFVFAQENGGDCRPMRARRLAQGGIRTAWDRILVRAGIANLQQYDLRRTLAYWLSQTGSSNQTIARLLRLVPPASTGSDPKADKMAEAVEIAIAAMFAAAAEENELLH